MAIFPIVSEEIIKTDIIVDRGINFLYDFNRSDFARKDGKLIELTGDAAVAFWIEKTIRTEFEQDAVYENTGYGTEFKRFKGSTLPNDILKLELSESITNSLLKHERIKSIRNVEFEKVNSEVTIGFYVELNAITEEDEALYSSESGFTRISNLEDIKQFLGLKLITSDGFYFKTSLNKQVYVY